MPKVSRSRRRNSRSKRSRSRSNRRSKSNRRSRSNRRNRSLRGGSGFTRAPKGTPNNKTLEAQRKAKEIDALDAMEKWCLDHLSQCKENRKGDYENLIAKLKEKQLMHLLN